jgi:hypothetical protein
MTMGEESKGRMKGGETAGEEKGDKGDPKGEGGGRVGVPGEEVKVPPRCHSLPGLAVLPPWQHPESPPGRLADEEGGGDTRQVPRLKGRGGLPIHESDGELLKAGGGGVGEAIVLSMIQDLAEPIGSCRLRPSEDGEGLGSRHPCIAPLDLLHQILPVHQAAIKEGGIIGKDGPEGGGLGGNPDAADLRG